jgi:hypothetical protein
VASNLESALYERLFSPTTFPNIQANQRIADDLMRVTVSRDGEGTGRKEDTRLFLPCLLDGFIDPNEHNPVPEARLQLENSSIIFPVGEAQRPAVCIRYPLARGTDFVLLNLLTSATLSVNQRPDSVECFVDKRTTGHVDFWLLPRKEALETGSHNELSMGFGNPALASSPALSDRSLEYSRVFVVDLALASGTGASAGGVPEGLGSLLALRRTEPEASLSTTMPAPGDLNEVLGHWCDLLRSGMQSVDSTG